MTNTKKIIFPVLAAFLLLTTTACLDKLFVNSMYPYDSANKTKVPSPVPEPYSEDYVESENEDKIHMWYYSGAVDRPVVIHFHGNGYNIGGAYKGGLLDKLKELNYNVVIWDYPAYGNSSGKPSEKSITSASLAVMEKVETLFPNQKKVLWGFSLGTGIATKTANLIQDKVDGLVLVAPWDYAYRVAMEAIDLSEKKAKKIAKGNQWKSAEYAEGIRTPTLIVHGKADTVIPYKLGKNLFSHFPQDIAIMISPEEAEHNNILNSEFWNNFSAFVESIL